MRRTPVELILLPCLPAAGSVCSSHSAALHIASNVPCVRLPHSLRKLVSQERTGNSKTVTNMLNDLGIVAQYARPGYLWRHEREQTRARAAQGASTNSIVYTQDKYGLRRPRQLVLRSAHGQFWRATATSGSGPTPGRSTNGAVTTVTKVLLCSAQRRYSTSVAGENPPTYSEHWSRM